MMLIPVCIAPHAIKGAAQEILNANVECICGKEVPLKDGMAVWTTKQGEDEPAWFPVCNFRCYTLHIAEGNA